MSTPASGGVFRKVLSAGAWVSAGLLLGRMSGLLRDLYIASVYGVSEQADSAALLLALPDVIVNMVTGGAIGYVLIPEIKRLKEKGHEAFLQASLISAVAFSALALVFHLKSSWMVDFFAPGFSPEHAASAAPLFAAALPAIVVIGLSGVTTAALHAANRFRVQSLENVIQNTALIAAFALGLKRYGIAFLPIALIIASLCRWLSQLVLVLTQARAEGKRVFGFGQWHFDRLLLVRYFQSMMSGSLLFLFPVAARQLASYGHPGSVALLHYASKLVDVPMGLAVTAFAKVLFPRLSEHYLSKDSHERGNALARQGIRFVMVTTVSLSLSLAWLAIRVASHAPAWRGFSSEDVASLCRLAAIGFLGIPAQGMASITTDVFNSRRKTAPPFYILLGAILLFFPAGAVARHWFGTAGIMATYAAIQYLVLLTQMAVLRGMFGFDLFPMLFGKRTALTALACVAGFVPAAALSLLAPTGGLGGHFLAAVASFAGGAIAFYLGFRIARSAPEEAAVS